MKNSLKVAVIGYGAIGRPVVEHIIQNEIENTELLCVLTRTRNEPLNGIRFVSSIEALIAMSPDIVVEAGGGEAFSAFVPKCLDEGIDVLAVSVAAMADPEIERAVRAALDNSGAHFHIASGAVGGLDALSAAAESELTRVELVQRKPLRAFPDLDQNSTTATVVSQGSAREAACAFPRNTNIAAAIALSGIGLDRTLVTIIADPAVSSNMAQLKVEGAFGEFQFQIENRPSPLNPSTAQLASLSVISTLRRWHQA